MALFKARVAFASPSPRGPVIHSLGTDFTDTLHELLRRD